MKYYLCLDVGGTEIKYNVLDENGNLKRETLSVRTPMPGKEGIFGRVPLSNYDEAKQEFVETIEILVKGVKFPISGIALSHPGEIETNKGMIHRGGSLNYLDDTNITELLNHLGCPISIENDARCVALAEQVSGAAQGIQNFSCITIGTGLGAGFVIDGEMLRGSRYRGGEFGLSLAGKNRDNKYLCFHELCSMSSLITRYAYLQKIDLSKQEVTGHDVFSNKQDPEVNQLINNWYEDIAVALQNIGSIFDSECILIGGGISARDDVINGIKNALHHLHSKVNAGIKWNNIPIVPCKYRNSAGLMGAFYTYQTLYREY